MTLGINRPYVLKMVGPSGSVTNFGCPLGGLDQTKFNSLLKQKLTSQRQQNAKLGDQEMHSGKHERSCINGLPDTPYQMSG